MTDPQVPHSAPYDPAGYWLSATQDQTVAIWCDACPPGSAVFGDLMSPTVAEVLAAVADHHATHHAEGAA